MTHPVLPVPASPDLNDFAVDVLTRVTSTDREVAAALREPTRTGDLLGCLVDLGCLSRIAARAVRLAHAGRYDAEDVRQLVQAGPLRDGLVRLAGAVSPGARPASELSTTGQVAVRATPTPTTPIPVASLNRLPRVGAELGNCLLVEQIGQGAVGVVFRAFHRKLGKTVAVKVLRGDVVARDPAALDRLRDEARVLASIEHPNVVRVHDFDDDPARPYLVLECIEGPTLSETIGHGGCLRPDRALAVARQTAVALAAAWSRGVVHRDLKPANILLTRDGTAKLTDFGLAVVVGEPTEAAPQGVVGTAAYMSPEHIRTPDRVDHRSDMYGLGVTLYQMLTGTLPFVGTSTAAVWFQHLNAPPVPPAELVPGLSAGLSNFVLRLLEKEPTARFDDYHQLVEALDEAARG